MKHLVKPACTDFVIMYNNNNNNNNFLAAGQITISCLFCVSMTPA